MNEEGETVHWLLLMPFFKISSDSFLKSLYKSTNFFFFSNQYFYHFGNILITSGCSEILTTCNSHGFLKKKEVLFLYIHRVYKLVACILKCCVQPNFSFIRFVKGFIRSKRIRSVLTVETIPTPLKEELPLCTLLATLLFELCCAKLVIKF